MAKGLPHTLDHRELVDPGYAEMLRALVKGEGIEQADIMEAAGIGRTTVYRVLSGKDLTVKGVVTVYNALLSLRPGLEIPPPLMPVSTRREYRWMRIGQMLLEADESVFDQTIEQVSAILDRVEVSQHVAALREIVSSKKDGGK